MCIIIAKPKDVSIPTDHFIESIENNPDGWGVSWRDENGKLQFLAGWDANDFSDAMYQLPMERPWLFHARWATHGAAPYHGLRWQPRDAELNRQPFVHSDLGWALAHNGILDERYTARTAKGPSDSRVFATEVAMRGLPVRRYVETGKHAQEARRQFRKLIGKGWNKIALLYEGSDEMIPFHLEGDGWHCEKGVWYSNYGYMPSYGYGYYDCGSGVVYDKSASSVVWKETLRRLDKQADERDKKLVTVQQFWEDLDTDTRSCVPDLVSKSSKQYGEPEVACTGDPKAFLCKLLETERLNGSLMLRDVEEAAFMDPEGAAALIFDWYKGSSVYVSKLAAQGVVTETMDD